MGDLSSSGAALEIHEFSSKSAVRHRVVNMSHHRESSAFMPVVPSRGVHPMLYSRDIRPLLGSELMRESRERGDHGKPPDRGSSGAVRKTTPGIDFMAMMADKREEQQLREDVALMMPHRPPAPPPGLIETGSPATQVSSRFVSSNGIKRLSCFSRCATEVTCRVQIRHNSNLMVVNCYTHKW